MTLNIELDQHQSEQLQIVAQRLNISVNELAKAAITDLITKLDHDFEQAASRVLNKNTELYKRLAQ